MATARLFEIPAGVAGTRETLAYMRALVRREHALPIVRQTAIGIVKSAALHPEASAALIRQWIGDHVAFVRDPRGVELLTAPATLLTTIRTTGSASGDCDDVAILAAALGLAIGMRARFVAVGRSHFEHVFTVLGDPSGRHWWELDTTRPFQDVPAELQRTVFTTEV